MEHLHPHATTDPDRRDHDGVDIYRFRQLRSLLPWPRSENRQSHHPPFADPVTTRGIRRLMRDFEPDVVHAR